MAVTSANDEKNNVALLSAMASASLAMLKIVAAIFTGSLALLSEAFHSLIDFGATLVTMAAVKAGTKPADDDHHYGHAKIESLAALFESLFLLATAIGVTYFAVNRLRSAEIDVTFTIWAILLLIVSIVVDYNRSHALQKTAEKTSSEALAADALHFDADMWSSGGALLGLLGVYLGYGWADSVMAILISLFIAFNAVRLARKSTATLLDEAPSGLTAELKQILDGRPEVLQVTQMRIRPSGPTLFVDAAINVPRTLAATEIAALKSELTASLLAAAPQADVTISANPVEVSNETAFEKVNLIARHRALSIHHVMVQKIGDKLAVSFDLEVDGATSLEAAHAKATDLESEIRDSLGLDVEVESHIEPLPNRQLKGRPAVEQVQQALEQQLAAVAARQQLLSDLHNIRIRTTDDGLIVHYHCRFPPQTTVNEVHAAVDAIEDHLKADNSQIRRVVAHAEPVGARLHML